MGTKLTSPFEMCAPTCSGI